MLSPESQSNVLVWYPIRKALRFTVQSGRPEIAQAWRKLPMAVAMPIQIKSTSPVRLSTLNMAGWIFLAPGLFLLGKSTLENFAYQHVTASSIAWASIGLLLIFLGSTLKSFRK